MTDGTPAVLGEKLPYFFVSFVLLILAYTFNNGLFYHPAQLWLLVLSWLVLLLPLLKNKWLVLKNFGETNNYLLIICLISFILFYFFDNGIYLISKQGFNNIVTLKFLALILFLLYFIRFDFRGQNLFSVVIGHLAKYKFYYLIGLALVLRLLVIYYSPAPKIDVYWVLNGGAQAILEGHNPYSATFKNIYSTEACLAIYHRADCPNDSYSYLPATILMTAPFYAIFGDIRSAFIFLVFGCALIGYLLLRKAKQPKLTAELITLLILYLPLSLFVLEQSWMDQLWLFLIYFFVWSIVWQRDYLAYFFAGLVIASKPTMLILPIFLSKYKGTSLKKIVMTSAVFVAVCLPFLFWNYHDFVKDILFDQIKFDGSYYSLSFFNVFKMIFFSTIPAWISILMTVIGLAYIWVKGNNSLTSVIHGLTLFLLAVFIIQRGFVNYYFSLGGLLILLIILELIRGQGEDKILKFQN